MFWSGPFYFLYLTSILDTEAYEVQIENGVLKGIVTSEELTHLNLSSSNIKNVTESAFVNLPNLKSLDLSNNTIHDLPLNVFSNLKNLEYLSLAKNYITNVSHRFTNLNKLKKLDISHQWKYRGSDATVYLPYLSRAPFTPANQSFAGLPDDTEINVSGSDFFITLNPRMFSVNKSIQIIQSEEKCRYDNFTLPLRGRFDYDFIPLHLPKDFVTTSLCTSGNFVKLVVDNSTSDNCLTVKSIPSIIGLLLNLDKKGIKNFEKNWYNLSKGKQFVGITLNYNDMEEISASVLNDLPKSITVISITNNRNVKRLGNNVINNRYIEYLVLRRNGIEFIENDALRGLTSLKYLDLSANRLSSMDFAFGLSKSLMVINLEQNKLENFPDKVFSNLTALGVLNFAQNKLTNLKNNMFKGTRDLKYLDLSKNDLRNVSKGDLDGLVCLKFLDLSENFHIDPIETGFARDLKNLDELFILLLRSSNLKRINRGLFYGLPLGSKIMGPPFANNIQPGAFKNYS